MIFFNFFLHTLSDYDYIHEEMSRIDEPIGIPCFDSSITVCIRIGEVFVFVHNANDELTMN